MTRKSLPSANLSPEELAAVARLQYVCDQEDGFTRRRNGQGFVYLNKQSRVLRDKSRIRRIEKLAIPPAWRDVWICSGAKGHLQVTGRDSRGRKQYIYHPRWREISNLAKFCRLRQFGRSLPKLRLAVAKHLAQRTLTRQRVLAGIVALLDATSIRIGNEEYVQENNSYGLTTLRDRHLTINDDCIEIRFVGKGGFRKQCLIDNRRLVCLLEQCRDVQGSRLFQYVDENGVNRAITSADVNAYLQEVLRDAFTAKDFRTWKASAQVAGRLFEHRSLDRVTQRRRILKAAIAEAADALGNTPTVSRNYYIHPGLIESFEDGSFANYFAGFRLRRAPNVSRDEQALARFLRKWEARATLPPLDD